MIDKNKIIKYIFIKLLLIALILASIFTYLALPWLIAGTGVILILFVLLVYGTIFSSIFAWREAKIIAYIVVIISIICSVYLLMSSDYQPYRCCSAFEERYNPYPTPYMIQPIGQSSKINIICNESLNLPILEGGGVHNDFKTANMTFYIENKLNETVEVTINPVGFIDEKYIEFYYCHMSLTDHSRHMVYRIYNFDYFTYTDTGGYNYESCECTRTHYDFIILDDRIELSPFEKRMFTLEYTFEKAPEVVDEEWLPDEFIAFAGTYQDEQVYDAVFHIFDGVIWSPFVFEMRT